MVFEIDDLQPVRERGHRVVEMCWDERRRSAPRTRDEQEQPRARLRARQRQRTKHHLRLFHLAPSSAARRISRSATALRSSGRRRTSTVAFAPLFDITGGHAGDVMAGRDVLRHRGLRRDLRAPPEAHVARDARLPRHHRRRRRATVLPAMPTCAAQQHVAADPDAVCDLDQVVDLRPGRRSRLADRGPIDGGVCATFDVVLDDDAADLGNLLVRAVRPPREAEAVAADHGGILHDDPIPRAPRLLLSTRARECHSPRQSSCRGPPATCGRSDGARADARAGAERRRTARWPRPRRAQRSDRPPGERTDARRHHVPVGSSTATARGKREIRLRRAQDRARCGRHRIVRDHRGRAGGRELRRGTWDWRGT